MCYTLALNESRMRGGEPKAELLMESAPSPGAGGDQKDLCWSLTSQSEHRGLQCLIIQGPGYRKDCEC